MIEVIATVIVIYWVICGFIVPAYILAVIMQLRMNDKAQKDD